MRVVKRLFGLSVTGQPADGGCWTLESGVVTVDLARAPELSDPGSALRLEGEGLETRILLVNGIDGRYHAYQNNCACSGWRVDPVPGEEKIRCCTLAASTYDYSGRRIAGPAKDDLTALEVSREGDTLTISLG